MSEEIDVMNFDSFFIKRLSPELASFSFDCDQIDLNEFYKDDALLHDQEYLTRTYLVFSKDDPGVLLAYFSLANDKISSHLTRSGNQYRKVKYNVPSALQRYNEFPAVKLARLAVAKDYQDQDVGSYVFYLIIKDYLSSDMKSGCRFMTVDSTVKADGFYLKMGFKELQLKKHEHESDSTVSMYVDLLDLKVLFKLG
jgi:GNAT superfamily N-acetyltransferase